MTDNDNEKPVRFRALLPIGDKIMEDYLDHDMTMAEIARAYGHHYSNLRRYIKFRLKEMGIDEEFEVQHINQEDFPYLDIGDSFQFAEWLTIFSIVKLTKKDGDLVFEMVPSKYKNPVRHWICDERQPPERNRRG